MTPRVDEVYSEGKTEKAKLTYNNQPFIVTQGQSVGDFKVVDIRSKRNKVIFIYGDEKVIVKKTIK